MTATTTTTNPPLAQAADVQAKPERVLREVDQLKTHFFTESGVVQAVQGGEGTIGYADASQAGELGTAHAPGALGEDDSFEVTEGVLDVVVHHEVIEESVVLNLDMRDGKALPNHILAVIDNHDRRSRDDDPRIAQIRICGERITIIFCTCISCIEYGMPPTPWPETRRPANGIQSTRNAVWSLTITADASRRW